MREECGIIVGCDAKQEWMLPWWWEHYSRKNDYPVSFFDFGMSEMAKAWCRKRGRYCSLPELGKDPVVPESDQVRSLWESKYGKCVWKSRSAWMKKPLSMLESPFDLTIWVDLDCEVRASVEPLFQVLSIGIDIAIAREIILVKEMADGELEYNSAVVAFRKGAAVIRDWVEGIEKYHLSLSGDQEVLSRIIAEKKYLPFELSVIYNCPTDLKELEQIIDSIEILHHCGPLGKAKLLESMGEANFARYQAEFSAL